MYLALFAEKGALLVARANVKLEHFAALVERRALHLACIKESAHFIRAMGEHFSPHVPRGALVSLVHTKAFCSLLPRERTSLRSCAPLLLLVTRLGSVMIGIG